MSGSSKQGYNTIPEYNEQQSAENEGHSPINPPSFGNRVKQSKLIHYLRTHLATLFCLLVTVVVILFVFFASILPEVTPFPAKHHAHTVKVGVSQLTMDAGRAKCEKIQLKSRERNAPSPKRKNPRSVAEQVPILLKNAIVWDGQGGVLENVDVFINNGTIEQVENNIKLSKSLRDSVKVIDVAGHIVSPGLVDMHSHMGVDSWPELAGTDDTNEMTQPLTPFVRTLDAFNPSDNAIRIVSSGGVTTALVLPGSGNLMGGEAFVFKLRHVDTLSNDDMLAQANIDEQQDTKWRWMKMACGENPKRVYGSQGQMPSTRLGEAYLFRKELSRAQTLMREQDDWCKASQGASVHFDSAFPEDLSLESLVALLRGDVLLNVHCYETHDIEAMVRHSLEFNFTISAFHHALDAYRIPAILRRARNNITIATFADHWGYKKEAFQAIPQAPKILYDAGIPVALKSDHPVLNSQHLVFEAAKSSHYGLPPQEAFKAVTSVPANAIGLGHRVGSLKVGYDADVVIWDREPLELGATPLQVFIDGIPQFEEKEITPVPAKKASTRDVNKKDINRDFKKGAKSYVLKNAGYSFLENEPAVGPLELVIKNGAIVCSAADCSNSILSAQNNEEELPVYDLKGGYILPGLVGVGSSLGLVEIQSEDVTGDGFGRSSNSQDAKDIIQAVDGLKLGTRHLEEAYKGGVLTAITAPMSSNVVIGVSSAFKTGSSSLLEPNALLSSAVALHLQVGTNVKSSSFPTISSQISFIRRILTDNIKSDNYYGQAARGELPTIITAHNKDEIASLIVLKRDHVPKARFVIHGGTEAYMVAPHLAELDIPVILQPVLCTPSNFDSIHCLTGAPLTNGTAGHVLQSYGVKIGIGIHDDGLARNLAWDAGWLSATSPSSTELKNGEISENQAIRFITSNLREIYGLSNSLVENEEFIVYSGSPFDVNSKLILIHTSNDGIYSLP